MPEVGQVSEVLDRLQVGLAGRYRLEDEIGRGGMSTVYRALDLKHDRTVAIKVMRPDLAYRGYNASRFLQEIQIAARLVHPQILPVHDSGEYEGLLYYVMPYLGPESLRRRLNRLGQLPIDEAIGIARSVAAALDYAHRHQVVHRDVKPENILLHEGEAMVADFGVARAIRAAGSDRGTDPGVAIGTPEYMSPEQASADRDLDGRSDLYSLGCVLFEMLAGKTPFAGVGPRAVMAKHVVEPAPSVRAFRPTVPVAVEQALARALAKDPAQRFATAADFARALDNRGSSLITRAAQEARAIAVLPLVNTSRDPENEYFSDGITDELINALMKVQGLRVASRTSVFALKGQALDVREIGKRLEVSVVLEGTVRRVGQRLRITVQLTDATDGRSLWSEAYDREIQDIFAIQEEIARTIVSTLRARFLGDIGDPTARRYTANVNAYNLYLKGRYSWNKRSPEGVAEGIKYFCAAIEEEPRYALAYSGLADSYAVQLDYRGAPVEEGMRRAKAEALKALELDESLAEAHTSLAWVTFIYDWDWVGAAREFRRAIELNPRYATARQWHSWLLMAMGRVEQALTEGWAAAELDPASVSIRRSLGWLYYYGRQYETAIDHLDRALVMNPTSDETQIIRALTFMEMGRFPEAEVAVREALTTVGETTIGLATLGAVHARAGRMEEARDVLRQLHAMAEQRYVSSTNFATLYAVLGDLDQAFAWLEKVYEERRGFLAYLKVDPRIDPLRQDPRFAALVTRMRLS
jgi:serine/threonine-protein kinase